VVDLVVREVVVTGTSGGARGGAHGAGAGEERTRQEEHAPDGDGAEGAVGGGWVLGRELLRVHTVWLYSGASTPRSRTMNTSP
jgi:hypothetical protein